MSPTLVCVIFHILAQLFWHNLCVSTYHICHNKHFRDGHKHVYYILDICNENFIYLFDNLDVDYSSDLYILSAKYFHIPYIQLFFCLLPNSFKHLIYFLYVFCDLTSFKKEWNKNTSTEKLVKDKCIVRYKRKVIQQSEINI